MRVVLSALAGALLLVSATFTASAFEDGRKAATSCNGRSNSFTTIKKWSRIQVESYCESVKTELIQLFMEGLEDRALKESLESWTQELAPEKLPDRLNLYWLTIANNRKIPVSAMFAHPDFLHSSYTATYGGWEFKIGGCSMVTVAFLSPQEPFVQFFRGTQGFVRGSNDWPGWHTDGFGEQIVVMPRAGMFYRWQRSEFPITKAFASEKTECEILD